MATVEISKISLPDGTICMFKDTTARQGLAAVATVSLTTTSEELYNCPIVVTNSIDEVETEVKFNSSGKAIAYISAFGTYKFTVTY